MEKMNYYFSITIKKYLYTMPSCGSSCQIIRQPKGDLPPPLPLVRSTHKICKDCSRSVSDYDHDYCYFCAPKGSCEYNFHHSRCLSKSKM